MILHIFYGFKHVDVKEKSKKMSSGCTVIPIFLGGAGSGMEGEGSRSFSLSCYVLILLREMRYVI